MNNIPANNKAEISPRLTEQALEQAARWFVDLQEANENSAKPDFYSNPKFIRWLQVAENQQAWQQISQIHQQYQNHQSQLNSQTLNNSHSANLLYDNVKLSRRGMLKSFAGLSCASWLGWQGYHSASVRNQLAGLTADVSSAVGQSKQLSLSNNTQLWLNTNTAINTFANHELELLKGEVYLDNFLPLANARLANTGLAKSNATTVATKLTTTINNKLLTLSTATGTTMSNNLDARAKGSGASCSMLLNEDHSQCSLSLYQGSASISFQGQSRQLIAGQHLLLTANKQGVFNLADAPTKPLDFSEKPPWLDGQLHANDIPLAEFVAQLRRYRSGYIRLQTELAHIRVAGVYPAFDSDAALDLLAKALPIQIHYLTPWFVSITA